MNALYRYGSLFFLMLFSLIGCAQQQLVILHTNDTHSRIEPLPETDRYTPGLGGVERRANYIDEVRRKNRQVLLFDAGDFLQGTPYFNLFKGEVEVKTMNLMKYDAVTLGNHEFDYGLEVLEKVVRMAHFPIVSTNYDFSETALAGLIRPYLILKKGGVRIGVMGINIQPQGLITANHYKGMKYLDPVTSANAMAKRLREEHRCDLVVCLSHLGYMADRELATETRGIDLIIGGHSHTHMTEPTVVNDLDDNEVIIFQTSGRGVNVGRIDVQLTKQPTQRYLTRPIRED
ncbi:MAG TPA: bifunctional metallophosphatase/5'-nucleotidase [Bacteroidales bacterium]|jgi:5'-nucleotidase|nr:bifunctional metallophosphatase/5'-nucleotidase [Bacteroidales bacterium]